MTACVSSWCASRSARTRSSPSCAAISRGPSCWAAARPVPGRAEMAEGLLKLRLYLAGGPSQVTTLAGQLEQAVRTLLTEEYHLQVINVLEFPEQAEQDDVIATPTLVLASSEPERRIIGDLDDGRLVFQKLGLL
ncbi:MAG: hypothetical protein C3L25_02040 [Candidatus Sedimenticola endophacoides]|uniref:KaiB domain-containing protein n=1 Tax=Candidatus Sedimenticola endophacoides TaxID=2548426 RepID=A0A6N4DLZ3_9GAMM|nr:MAG: hypothetical protein C3L24_11325 [Candidatus Sedimenticola endophacoides]PUE02047.1 MAG: hypothetical protein C3L26_02045 [Candidatus Sedimenticola endophacoides]PUE05056.1 MAG: hypothetical protein C3L25_02040 [Candidatus Sedimenticola endophacoides]